MNLNADSGDRATEAPRGRLDLDADTCYRALRARDRRFDGLFFVGVATTGIYCRPVCTARTPGRSRCRFYRTAAVAEQAGFRACLRCRPELAPGAAPVDSVPRLVAAAVARIDAGYLNEHSVAELAAVLGVSDRHLRRAVEAELGVSPVALAQSRRLALAKQLLHDTDLRLADIAFASGFASVRRFNALFRARFGMPPSRLRGRERAGAGAGAGLRLRLGYRPPLDFAALLAFLRDRAIPGVEEVTACAYRRTVRAGEATGVIEACDDPARAALVATVPLAIAGASMHTAARLRALFDLDAQPARVAGHLGGDRRLRRLLARRPGLRVPGAFDVFEVAVRAILGQQTSVRGASTLAGRLVRRFGAPLPAPAPPLTHTFPSPAALAAAGEAEISAIGLPRARARAVHAVAAAFAGGALRIDSAPIDEALAALEALPGIGPWTSNYVAMRALGWPDAFPAGDLGLRKALGGIAPAAARARAEGWRPWRAYAAMHLWQSLSEEALP